MTPLRLNKAHYPVTVLGPGRRVGIWFQGCSVGCTGCVSRDTWDAAGGGLTSVEAILGWCTRTFAHHGFDGVTISGGEPFEQPAALLALLQGLDTWRRVNAFEFDILCYSGWPLTKLRKRHVEILQLLDLLIPEPFVNKLPNALTWRGSSNQPLVPLSERGAAIARETVDAPPNKRFQLDVCNGSIWFIGVPDRGDLQRLEDIASRRGVALSGVSWRV